MRLLLLLLLAAGCRQTVYGGRWASKISECQSLESREEAPPTSIHDLRADDLRVLLGLGDSVMAGLGAKAYSVLDVPLIQEHRGLSFVMGGDWHAWTVPNFIRHYRGADVVGPSRGSHLVELCHDRFCPPDEMAYRPHSDAFNAAQTGATVGNVGLEMRYLLEQVRHHRAVNVTADWKMLTVLIGNNDVCHHACRQNAAAEGPSIADVFEEKLWVALERYRERIPRTLVVLMQLPDASQAHWFAHRHRRCLVAQTFLRMECPCAMGSEEDRWAMRLLTAELNERLERLAGRINAAVKAAQPDRTQQDFAAIVMPFMRDTDLRDDVPQHFISKLDCFHPSGSAHRSMAMTFWRNLFTGQRDTKLGEETQVYCPSEEDRIVTF